MYRFVLLIYVIWFIQLYQCYSLDYVRIAGLFNFLERDSSNKLTNEKHKQGNQILAAYVMAINELNNKTDGIYDDLLPVGTKIRFAVAEESEDFITDINTNLRLNEKSFQDLVISNGTKPHLHGIIGGLTNRASDAIAQVTNGFKLTQVAYGSTGSFLSYIGIIIHRYHRYHHRYHHYYYLYYNYYHHHHYYYLYYNYHHHYRTVSLLLKNCQG